MTRIYLIRHGESEWNAAHRYTGQQDVALSALGHHQALGVAERLANESIAAIYSSPLRRAHHTALALSDRKRMPVLLDDRLKEICHGAWEGLTASQVERRFGDDYARWRTEPTSVVMPEGESLHDLFARLDDFRRDLRQVNNAAVAVCSHDAALRALMLSLLGLGLEHFWKFSFENGSLTTMESFNRGWNLTALNDTGHLNGCRSDAGMRAL